MSFQRVVNLFLRRTELIHLECAYIILLKKSCQLENRLILVYPIIEESAQLDLEALAANYAAIQKIFSPYKVECLHGKMHIEDKKLSMQRFINKEAQLLVATTVIEVGVDVPSATVMLIEEADRFGLAQLHQLRGRIGRGSESSYCILMTKSRLSADARKRIAALLRTQDGFELAEEDLKQRGPGNMLGTQQSGVMRFKISDVVEDKQTFIETRVPSCSTSTRRSRSTSRKKQKLPKILWCMETKRKRLDAHRLIREIPRKNFISI